MHDRVEEPAVLIRGVSVRGVPRSRMALLFGLFFLICMGLGYSILNRIDWQKAPGGLEDIQTYASLVVAPPVPDVDNHMQYRVLVPYLARPFYRLAKDHIGSWDPIMFGLLIVDSFFVTSTVILLLLVVYRVIGSYNIALGSALIYLLNFAVPNLRLIGFIDAGEGFFLMLLVWVLLEEQFWTLPIMGIVGATAKESFVPYLVVFTFTWWLCSRRAMRRPIAALAWIVAAWFAALTSITALQWSITHVYRSPLRFGLELHNNTAYVSHFLGSFADRNLWYIFVWLLPLSIFRLKRLPRSWRFAAAVTTLAAFAMNTYYGGAPGTIGRSLFSVAGPLLSAAVAILLFTGYETGSDTSIRIAPPNAT